MGRIYSKARRVLISLDEDTEAAGGTIGSTMQLDSYFKSLYCNRRITNLYPAFGTWMTILSDAFPTSKLPADFDWGTCSPITGTSMVPLHMDHPRSRLRAIFDSDYS